MVTPTPHRKRSTVSPLEMTMIGAMGGSIEVTMMQPLVGIKNALQEGRPVPTKVGHLYRGLALNIMSMAPITASQFGANKILQTALGADNGELSGLQKFACAAGAGAMSSLVASPSELIIIHQQKNGRSLSAETTHFLKTYGFQHLTRGVVACAGREAVYAAGYLGLCPIMKDAIDETEFGMTLPRGASTIIAGISGGTFAAMLSQPFDTAKTRMQAFMYSKPEYTTLSKTLYNIYKNDGLGELWKGAIPRLTRIIAATFILNYVRTTSVEAIDSYREAKAAAEASS